MQFVWPIKCVNIEGGVLCIFDLPEVPTVADAAIDIDVMRSVDGEWVIAVDGLYCVPVAVLGIGARETCDLYLVGGPAGILEAKLFAHIPLDVKALVRIEVLTEMPVSNEPSP